MVWWYGREEEKVVDRGTISHWICNYFSRYLVRGIWFKKSGSRKMVLQIWIFFLVREKGLIRKKVGLYYKSTYFRLEKSGFANSDIFFSGSRKVVDQKKNPTFQNHFSTLFLVADWMAQWLKCGASDCRLKISISWKSVWIYLKSQKYTVTKCLIMLGVR